MGFQDLPEELQSLIYSKLFEHARLRTEVQGIYDSVPPVSKTERRLLNEVARRAYESLPLPKVDVLVESRDEPPTGETLRERFPGFKCPYRTRPKSIDYPTFNIFEGADVEDDPDPRLDVIAWDGPAVIIRFPVHDTKSGTGEGECLFKYYWNYPYFTVRDIVKIVSEFYRGEFTHDEIETIVSGLKEKYTRAFPASGDPLMDAFAQVLTKAAVAGLIEEVQDLRICRPRTFFMKSGYHEFRGCAVTRAFMAVFLFKE